MPGRGIDQPAGRRGRRQRCHPSRRLLSFDTQAERSVLVQGAQVVVLAVVQEAPREAAAGHPRAVPGRQPSLLRADGHQGRGRADEERGPRAGSEVLRRDCVAESGLPPPQVRLERGDADDDERARDLDLWEQRVSEVGRRGGIAGRGERGDVWAGARGDPGRDCPDLLSSDPGRGGDRGVGAARLGTEFRGRVGASGGGRAVA